MQNVIEIAISLVLVFLTVSLIVTAINEIVSRLSRQRARTLWRGLRAIIDDPGLRRRFYANGLLVNAQRASAADEVAPDDRTHPSYIAPRTFAKALVMSAGLEPTGGADTAPRITLAEVERTVATIENRRIRDVLVSALNDAGGDLARFEAALETWYQTAMDRLAGDYKRYKQTLSFLVGLGVAVALNVDAVALAVSLREDDETRMALVQSAIELAQDGDALDPCGVAGGGAEGESAAPEQVECLVQNLGPLFDRLEPAALGWPDGRVREIARNLQGGETGLAVALILGKLVGWLATAFAATLGAPFWFDLLKRFVNVRAAGVKPADARTA